MKAASTTLFYWKNSAEYCKILGGSIRNCLQFWIPLSCICKEWGRIRRLDISFIGDNLKYLYRSMNPKGNSLANFSFIYTITVTMKGNCLGNRSGKKTLAIAIKMILSSSRRKNLSYVNPMSVAAYRVNGVRIKTSELSKIKRIYVIACVMRISMFNSYYISCHPLSSQAFSAVIILNPFACTTK